MKYCTNCGTENADEAKYCIKYGAKILVLKNKNIGCYKPDLIEKRIDDFSNEIKKNS
ncbi:MAG: zinc ribbon domain-containing protein [Candidatus Thermoplasmatota archaeon]